MRLLDRIFPTDTFLAPRLMEEVRQWSPGADRSVEFRTGQLLACAGDCPILVHRSVATPDALAAMADAGLTLPGRLETYLTRRDYIDRVEARIRRGERAVFVYSHPPGLFADGCDLVDNPSLQFLNNKENIAALAPPSAVLERTIISAEGIAGARLPCVVKVASDDPTGGSADIAVCRNRRHLKRAAQRFAQAGRLVVEAFVEARSLRCLQYNIRADGDIDYLGGSDQICTAAGGQTGNLIDPDNPPSPAMISLGREIARAGADRGFQGIAGFDFLESADGHIFAVDLNFRSVSSTAQVLLHDHFAAARSLPASRLANFSIDGDLPDILSRCRKPVEAGWLVPLTFFDPRSGGFDGGAIVRALVMAESPAAIIDRQRQLAAEGLYLIGGEGKIGGRLRTLRRRLWARLIRA